MIANKTTLISFISMLVNIILFIINVFVVRRNAKIEFNRKKDLYYYEITVITAMKNLFRTISSIRLEYYQLKNNYNPQNSKTVLKENCENHLKKIDEYIESMEHNSSVLIQVYSESSNKILQKAIEEFDDSCTDIISKYSCELKARKIDSHTEAFNTAISKMVEEIYQTCKKLNP